MANLEVKYMGLKLRNPFVAGASKLTSNVDTIKKLEEAGAGAIVCGSLFEEQVQLENLQMENLKGDYSHVDHEISDIFPDVEHAGPQEHLYWVKKAKEAVGIPVIGSLNCINDDTWVEYAKLMKQTGVDGLEINFFHVPSDMELSGEDVEKHQIEIIKKIKKEVKLPIAVKLSYFYSNTLNVIKKMDEAGADAVVLFNRLFQPDIDVDVKKHTTPFNLSNEGDNGVSLRFSGLLYNNIKADVIANTGILTAKDVAKSLLAGANSVQVVSALYKNGIDYMGKMISEFENWMKVNDYKSLDDFRGLLSKENIDDPFVYKRAQYVSLLMKSEELLKRYER